MKAKKCHQDLQFSRYDESFHCYTMKYLPKMSDSWSDDILCDDSGLDGDSTAAAILCKYRPLLPEMVLQMFAQQLPQYRIGTESGGSKEFIVPWPDEPRRSKASLLDQRAYASSQWRGDDMSLLEFLRKSGDDGKGTIVQWLTRKHKQYV
eukprot:12398771-Karenia_brevis.AAC.1